jgi:hypothetical protein
VSTWPNFYAEIGPTQTIRDRYAPEAFCEECGAKLSRYRTKSYGEWDAFCAPCMREDRHLGPRKRLCTACGENFLGFGSREVCVQCIVPSYRLQRSIDAVARAKSAARMFEGGQCLQDIATRLSYTDTGEVGRAIDKWRNKDFLAQRRGLEC